jgi:hypothetical protein
MQTNIEYNLHDCHMIPTLPQRDLRLKYLNNSLRATPSCDFVIQKQFRPVLIHVFLLFTCLSTFCLRQQTLRTAVRGQEVLPFAYRVSSVRNVLVFASQCADQSLETRGRSCVIEGTCDGSCLH